MDYKVKFNITRTERDAYIRQGTEVYRHPKGYFSVIEFQGKGGKFRECFYPYELMEV